MTGSDGAARPEDQQKAVEDAMEPVADLVGLGAEVVLTHGSGPQVGNLLVKNEMAADVVPPVPLDWCGAQIQGTIGVLILNALERALASRDLRRPVAALVTRTLVAADDPGFRQPTKPIGRYVGRAEADRMIALGQRWDDRGPRGWRRLVASPEPQLILDADAALTLLAAGYIVVAAGGGGVPVARAPDGSLSGIEAVIDKDLAAAVLGRLIRADVLVIATDVTNAVVGYGQPDARALGRVTPAELRQLAAEGQFASGSMGPKVEAALRFVEAGGRRAVITALDQIAVGADGRAGTVVEQPAGQPIGRPALSEARE